MAAFLVGATVGVEGTVSIRAPAPLSVDAVPGGSTIICSGETVDLTAPVGYNYYWNNGMTTQTITYRPASVGHHSNQSGNTRWKQESFSLIVRLPVNGILRVRNIKDGSTVQRVST